MITPYIKFEDLIKLHNEVVSIYQYQKAVNVLTYIVCGVLLIASVAVFIRIIIKVRDNAFLIFVLIMLIVGCSAGICVAYIVQDLFRIAYSFEVLIHTTTRQLIRHERANAYCLGIFFTCFNLAHWVFAIKYWSVSMRLECVLNKNKQL